MLHPLAPDLSNLNMDELLEKYNQLTKRYIQAQRLGSGSVLGQMSMLLEDYRQEIGRRQQKMLEDASNKNKNFRNIIDIQ
jgi:hypothetical protein